MIWTYEHITGTLWSETGELIGAGYSGYGGFRNRTDSQHRKSLGPIPCGLWTVRYPAFTHPKLGPVCMRLVPEPGTDVFGRSGFVVHGDSTAHPGLASNGCIILSRSVRERLAADRPPYLRVVSEASWREQA